MAEHQQASAFTIHFAAAVVLVAVLGIVDWFTGYELQFFIFYFMPVAFAAWKCGFGGALCIAVLSALVWIGADLFAGHPYSSLSYPLWNTFIRFIAFVALGYCVARIRALLAESLRISAELQKALSEVNTLSGLLPICSACKKVRNDRGYWQQIEDYIGKHTDLKFTHGYCEECAAKVLEEAGIRGKRASAGSK